MVSQSGEGEETLFKVGERLFRINFDNGKAVSHQDFYEFVDNMGYEHRGLFKSIEKLAIVEGGDVIYGEVLFERNDLFDVKLDGLWQGMVYALLTNKKNKADEEKQNDVDNGPKTLLVPSFFGRIKIDSNLMRLKTHDQIIGRFMVNVKDNTGDYLLFDSELKAFVVGKNMIFRTMPYNNKLPFQLNNTIDYSENKSKILSRRAGIISTSCRLPGNVKSIDDFWRLLTSKEIISRRIPTNRIPTRDVLLKGRKYGRVLEGGGFLEGDISVFDNKLFGISEIEAKSMDPQQRLLLTSVYEAMEKTGVVIGEQGGGNRCSSVATTHGSQQALLGRSNDRKGVVLESDELDVEMSKMDDVVPLGSKQREPTIPPMNKRDEIGVFVGTMGSEYLLSGDHNALSMLGNSISFLSGRLNYYFDFRGASVVFDTACSSSLVALDSALRNLRSGRIQKAIVAGVNLILSEEALGQRTNGNLLSPDGICHSFDERASGYGRSDGIVVMILEMEREGREYEAIIEDTNVNHDGRSAGLTAPNGNAHYDLIRDMVEGRNIGFWECHGTGTALGDPIELNALNKVISDSRDANNKMEKVYLSTAKAWMGHSEAASGLVGVMKAILQLKYGLVLGLPDLGTVNKQIKLDKRIEISKEDKNFTGNSCGVSSFGVAGTNACVILSKCDVREANKTNQNIGVIPVSAKTISALKNMEEIVENRSDWREMAVGFGVHRKHFRENRSVYCIRNKKLEKIKEVKMDFNDLKCELVEVDEEDEGNFYNILYKVLNRNEQSKIESSKDVPTNRFENVTRLLWKLNKFGIKMNEISINNTVYSLENLKQLTKDLRPLFSTPKVIQITVSRHKFVLSSLESFQDMVSLTYINRLPVDWAVFYPEPLSLPILRGLPTYQFDEKSFWKSERTNYFDHPIVGNVIEVREDTMIYEGFICKWRHGKLFEREVGIGLVIETAKGLLFQFENLEIQKIKFHSKFVLKNNVWMRSEVTIIDDSFNLEMMFDGINVVDVKGFAFSKKIDDNFHKEGNYVGVKYNHKCKIMIDSILFIDNYIPTDTNLTIMIVNHQGEITEFDDGTFKSKNRVLISFETKNNIKYVEENMTNNIIATPDRAEILSPRISSSDIREKVMTCIEKATLSEFDPNRHSNTSFAELGLDSLALIGFINELNSLDLVITSGDLLRYNTYNQLVDFFTKKQNESGYSSARNTQSPDILETTYIEQSRNNSQIANSKVPTASQQPTDEKTAASEDPDITFLSDSNVLYVLKEFKAERKPDFTLKILSKGRTVVLSYKYLNTRSKITFKGLSIKLLHLKPKIVQIVFISESEFNSRTASQLFLDLGKVFSSLQSEVSISVLDNDNWLSAAGKSFIKSFVAENPSYLKYINDEKLRRLYLESDVKRVSGVWVVTGGSSGLGLEMAKHLVEHHLVDQVVIISRNKPKTKLPDKIQHLKVDLTVQKDVHKIRQYINSKGIREINVIHSAGVSADCLFSQMTFENFQKPLMAKCDGLVCLLEELRPFKLGYLILNSSVSSVFGNVGQTNYSVANSFLDFIAKKMTEKAERVISINWGNWNQTGLAANEKTIKILEKQGFFGFRTDEALALFDKILGTNQINQVIVAKSDWEKMLENRPDLAQLLSEVGRTKIDDKTRNCHGNDVIDENKIDGKTEINQIIRSSLSELLKMKEEFISDNDGFLELGLDSLGMHTFSYNLSQKFKICLTVINLFEYFNITKLTDYISQQLTSDTAKEQPQNRKKKLKETASSPSLDSHLSKISDENENGTKVETKGLNQEDKPLPNLVFLFPGTFPLDQELNWDLFSDISYLARQLRTCSEYFEDLLNISIQKLISQKELNNLELPVQQAIIFSVNYSIAKFWTHCGLKPTHLLGHSLGELVAITMAGYLDLKQATKLVIHRAKGLTKARGKGQMVAAQREILSAVSLEQLDISIAADNADNQIVLSGPTKSMEKVIQEAERAGLVAKVLNPEFPFHSKQIRDEYLKSVNIFSWRKVKKGYIPVISNVTARPLVEFTAKYIKIHARSTVLFRESLNYVIGQGECVFLEVGLGHLLCSLVQKTLNPKNLHYLIIGSSVNGHKTLDLAKAKLELKGFDVDKKAFELATGRPTDVFDDLRAQHLSVRIKAKWQRRLSEEIQGKDKQINPSKLLLNKRIVEVNETDVEVIRDHVLFDLPTAPAAFLIKCFIDHAKFSEFKMADIRLLSKLYVDDLNGLITNLDGQRLQLKNENKLFASCLIAPKAFLEDPEFPSDDPGVRLNPQVFYNSLSRAGFHYGPSLRLLCDIRLMTGDRIRTKCAAPKKPWISIDLALQSLSCGLFDPMFPCCYVPVRIGELFARLPLVNDKNEWTFHGEITKKDPQMVEGNIAAFSNGVLSILIKDVKAVRMSRNTVMRPLRRNAISTDDELSDIQIVPRQMKRKSDSKNEKNDKKRDKSKSIDNADKMIKERKFLKKFASFDTGDYQKIENGNDKRMGDKNEKAKVKSKLMLKLSNPEKLQSNITNEPRNEKRYGVRENNVDSVQDFRLLPDVKTKFKPIYITGYYGKFSCHSFQPIFDDFAEISLNQDVLKLQYDFRYFSPERFNLSPREALFMDPAQRLLLLSADCLLQSLGQKTFPNTTGVFVGSSNSDFSQRCYKEVEPSGYLMPGSNQSSLSNRISHHYHLQGPSITLDTACASFSTAFSVAIDNIQMGHCSHAIVGAVNLILNDKTTEVLRNAGVLSPSHRCASFSDKADGYMRSEGFGLIMITTDPTKALFEIKKVSSIHVAGLSGGLYIPDKKAELSAMLDATADKVDLIECHGTGTSLGDRIELEAVNEYVKMTTNEEEKVVITASKSYLGHSEAASGLASLFSVINVMNHQTIPKIRGLDKVTNKIELNSNIIIPREDIKRPVKRALINNFGFTGSVNSFLVEKVDNHVINRVAQLEKGRLKLWPFKENDVKIEEVHKDSSKYKIDLTGRHVIRWNPNEEDVLNELLALIRTLRMEDDVVVITSKAFSFIVQVVAINFKKENLQTNITVISEDFLAPKIKFESIRDEYGSKKRMKKCLIIGGNSGIGKILLSVIQPEILIMVGRKQKEKYPEGISFYEANIDDYETLDQILNNENENETFDCVINCAGVVDNVMISNVTFESLEKTFKPKVDGTRNLIKLCHKYGITKIISISSIAALFGSFGQINYVLANSLMEKIIEESGLDYLILNLGPIKGAGMLADYGKQMIRDQIRDSGWGFIEVRELRDALEKVWWRNGQFKITADNKNKEKSEGDGNNERKNIEEDLQEVVRNIGGLDKISENKGLMSLGFDSLSVEQLRQSIQKRFKVKIEPVEMFENVSYKDLLVLVKEKIEKKVRKEEEKIEEDTKKTTEFMKNDDKGQRLGIVSFSAEIPKCENEFEFFEKLLQGKTLFEHNEDENDYIACSSNLSDRLNFDFSRFEISDNDLKILDITIKYAIKHSYIALERAGYNEKRREGMKIGVITCCEPKIHSEYHNHVKLGSGFASDSDLRIHPKRGSLMEMYMANQKDFLSVWISHILHLTGPSFSVYSACSSALSAIYQAKNLLSNGIDMVVVTSVNVLDMMGHERENGSVLASEQACRPFSKQSTGTLRGSFVGSLLLKQVNDDEEVMAIIENVCLNNDGGQKKSNFMAPSIAGQSECIKNAINGINHVSKSIDYIECHGTGTQVGDAIEIRALKNAFSECNVRNERKIFLGSVKANLGHCFAASGMASIIKSLMILRTGRIPKQINISSEEEIIDEIKDSMFEVPLEDKKVNKNNLNVLINCFGIGGTNGSIVLSKRSELDTEYEQRPLSNKIFFLPISGESPEGCLKMASSLSAYLKTFEVDNNKMHVISNTLINQRTAAQYRVCITTRSREEAIQKLDNIGKEQVFRVEENPKMAIYLCHQGVEYPEILRTEIEDWPDLRDYFDDLYSNSLDPEASSLSIYSISKGIFKFLKDFGMDDPSVLIGHSLGEYTALSLAKAIDDKKCKKLIKERGKMIKTTEKTKIVAVKTKEMHLEGFELSAVLSDDFKTFVTTNENNQIEWLKEQGLDYKVLKGDYGFHSRFIYSIKADFERILSNYHLDSPQIPLISTFDGQIIEEPRNAGYLADHLVNPVRLDKALKALQEHFAEVKFVVEIGPESILKSLLPHEITHIPTLPSYKGYKQGSGQGLWTALADLWSHGFSENLHKLSGISKNFDHWIPFCNGYKCDDRTILYDRFQREIDRNKANGTLEIRYNRGEFRAYHQVFNTVTFRGHRSSEVYFLDHNLTSSQVHDLLNNRNDGDSLPIICVKAEKSSIGIIGELTSQIDHLKLVKDIVIVIFTEAENVFGYMVAGVIDEILDENPSANIFHIVLESFDEIDDVIQLLKTNSINGKGIPHYRYIDHNLKQLRYKVTDGHISDSVVKNNPRILLVGYGNLGEAIHHQLERRFHKPEIVLMSRSKKREVDYIHCDLTDQQIIQSAVRDLFHIYNHVDYCIFLAGVKPLGDRCRGEEEKIRVLSPKLALYQLLREFSDRNIKIGTLILTSSLSSVTGLPYISEYVMASNFLDGIAINSHLFPGIRNILSLQLPPLKGSEMMKREGKLLEDNSVDIQKAAEWMVEMMIDEKNGILAYSNENPAKIREFIRGTDDSTQNNYRLVEKPSKNLDKISLKEIWRSVLNRDLKDEDDFYGLGGNSLNGLQIIWAVQSKYNINLKYEDLAENSRFRDFFELISSRNTNEVTKIRPRGLREGPLSYPQEQMYFLYKTDPQKYNIMFFIRFEAPLDNVKLQKTLFSLLKRQSQLRTVFFETNGGLKQEILDPEIGFNRSLILESRNLDELICEEQDFKFDLSLNAFRFIIGDDFVLVNQQHIITDGWSVSVFASEFSKIFRGEDLGLLSVNYIDYSLHQRENYNLEKEKDYCNYLKTLPSEGTIIWNHRLSANKDGTTRKEVTLSSEITKLLKEKAANHSTSLFKTEDNKKLVIGVPNAGREYKETAGLIGYFLNNWVIAVDVKEIEISFENCLRQVDKALKLAENFAQVPYHKAVAQVRGASTGEYTIFQTFFNYRHRLEFPEINLGPGIKCTVTQVNNSNIFPFSCTVDELDDANIKITLEWNPLYIHLDVIEIFADEFIVELRGNRMVDVEIIEEEGPFEDVVSMFLRQDKNRIALQYHDDHCLYGELREKIRRNSEYLKAHFKGITGREIGAEDVIPLWIESSLMPEWILTVLYTGAAFCPMNLSEPARRINEKVALLNANVLITTKISLEITVPTIRTRYHPHDYFHKTYSKHPHIIPSQLAYVLYTSGSTGVPKAVQIEHGQLNSFLQRARDDFKLTKDTVIGCTVSFTFDVSLFNLFGSLCFGGKLVQKDSPTDFIDSSDHFTHLFFTSAMLNSLNDEKIRRLNTDWLIVGGETPLTEKLTAFYSTGNRLSQIYGPTETTIWTAVNHYEQGIEDGRIIGTSTCPFVIATPFSKLPQIQNPGSIGELWILGSQTARGYINGTAGFVNNAFGTNRRGFRTGDLVFEMTDKRLLYLGRLDETKKIRGIRIDLQEIRNIIVKIFRHPFWLEISDENIILVVEDGKNWVGWKEKLREELAEYQIPNRLMEVGKIPLNTNGKVDSKRLQMMIKQDVIANVISVDNQVYGQLTEIWKSILGESIQIEPADNFFCLGGHSLTLIRLQSLIEETFGIHIALSSLAQTKSISDMVTLIEKQSRKYITVIRESPEATKSVYCIHAIGGTVYPYYSLLSFWPEDCNIYGIGYDDTIEADDLIGLAKFYHKTILYHVKKGNLPFFLLGHSLGGILAWEIAIMHHVNSQISVIVMAVDSWALDNHKLNESAIKSYLTTQFEHFDNRKELLIRSMKLCKMLKSHTISNSGLKIILFKAKDLGKSEINSAIRRDLTQNMVRSVIDNGWGFYCDDLEVIPVNGDHDSLISHLNEHKKQIHNIINQI
ncbi:unnamed protein product [Bursaphelenchus xylophilus]|uniref:Fatty acid synthase n=1 Tax=Bursaphelenchus xylophilus TaxID=6326 RepID=A0A1I7RRA1_BURXY|nr:unnamed protein product [Bursaphelenchus xylophilus]CAG9130889.1 unnamed protein product [Bursaphelenchus xylophilus]